VDKDKAKLKFLNDLAACSIRAGCVNLYFKLLSPARRVQISRYSCQITLAGVGPRWAELGTSGNRMPSINHSRDHPEIAQRDPIPLNRSLNAPNHTRGRPIRPTGFSLGIKLRSENSKPPKFSREPVRQTMISPVKLQHLQRTRLLQ